MRSTQDAATWNRLVDGFDERTPFHRFGFLSDMCAMFGWRFHPFIVEDQGMPIGVLPVLSLRSLPASPSAPFPYVGPLVPAGLLPATLTVLRSWQRRMGHLFVRMSASPQACRPEISERHGVASTSFRTYVLDLSHQEVECYRAGLHKDRRAALRRAERLGVRAREAKPQDARLLPDIMRASFARRGGSPSYPVDVLADWVEAQLRCGTGLYAQTVLEGDQPVGLLLAMREGASAYGWIGGTLRTDRSSVAGTVAYDAIIREAVADGVSRFDFVGHVDDGVARFKRSFGAVEREYWDVTSSLLPSAVERLGRRWHGQRQAKAIRSGPQ